MEKIVLWTGGWDSTYRVLDLTFNHHVTVRPLYIMDPNRPSVSIEQETMLAIADEVNSRLGKTAILSVEVANRENVEILDGLESEIDLIKRDYKIGDQYLWIGSYCLSEGLADVDLCIHSDDKAYLPIRDYNNKGIPLSLFSMYNLPLIDETKKGMEQKARKSGFGDILEKSWFCHNPTPRGRPCGQCGPCRWTVKEGLGRRLPLGAKIKYYSFPLRKNLKWYYDKMLVSFKGMKDKR